MLYTIFIQELLCANTALSLRWIFIIEFDLWHLTDNRWWRIWMWMLKGCNLPLFFIQLIKYIFWICSFLITSKPFKQEKSVNGKCKKMDCNYKVIFSGCIKPTDFLSKYKTNNDLNGGSCLIITDVKNPVMYLLKWSYWTQNGNG